MTLVPPEAQILCLSELFEFSKKDLPMSQDLKNFLQQHTWPWEVLGETLTIFIRGAVMCVPQGQRLRGQIHPTAVIDGDDVVIEEGAVVEAHAFVSGPCYLKSQACVRHGAYVRGSVWAEPHSVIGHTTEAKGTLLLNGAKASHFAYIGDSILGIDTNLGAGTKLANLRFDKGMVSVHFRMHNVGQPPPPKLILQTGLKKCGALLGNRAQMGCNSVANPGTILLPDSAVGPNRTAHGVIHTKIAHG